MSDGFTRYRIVNSLLDGSVTHQVSLNASKIFQSIKDGAVYIEDIIQDTSLTATEIAGCVKELIAVGAVREDYDDLPDSFLGIKSQPLSEKMGYNFSASSLPDLFAVDKTGLERQRQEKRTMPRKKVNYLGSNLGTILSDDNLMAMANPYGQVYSAQISQSYKEEITAFMQQLMTAQQAQQQQQIKGGK